MSIQRILHRDRLLLLLAFAVGQAIGAEKPGNPDCDSTRALVGGPDRYGIHFQIENDIVSHWLGFGQSDRWYTNGVKVTATANDERHGNWLLCGPPAVAEWFRKETRSYEYQFGYTWGQLMFTPQDIKNYNPQPLDRYWGAWMFIGAVAQRRPIGNEDDLETFELDYGVLGPLALGEEFQKTVHRAVVPDRLPDGWRNQLRNEPGIQFQYHRNRRLAARGAWDAAVNYGVNAGTVFDYASAGLTGRVGSGLAGAPVSTLENPALGGFGRAADRWYVLARFDVRGVLHNTFVDGSLFRSDPYPTQIHARETVLQSSIGFVKEWSSGWRVSVLVNRRGPEFNNVNGAKPVQTFGTFGVAFNLPTR